MIDDFCIFILSHDRPNNVPTARTLERCGYTGDWFIVVDNEDAVGDYKDEWGEDAIIYADKDNALPELDRGDNFNDRGTPLYTRFQIWDIAERLGYEYFLMLDDDYSNFAYKFNENFDFEHNTIRNLDDYLEASIKFLEKSGLDTLCMAQGGDYIGGENGTFGTAIKTKRKAMNSFLCKTDRPYDFRGVLNDDVNTYIRAQQLGKVFLTTNTASVNQEDTQQHEGGITGLYLKRGTYVKSFYTILYSPSSTTLDFLGDGAQDRIHHRISWRNAVPKIVPESAKNT